MCTFHRSPTTTSYQTPFVFTIDFIIKRTTKNTVKTGVLNFILIHLRQGLDRDWSTYLGPLCGLRN